MHHVHTAPSHSIRAKSNPNYSESCQKIRTSSHHTRDSQYTLILRNHLDAPARATPGCSEIIESCITCTQHLATTRTQHPHKSKQNYSQSCLKLRTSSHTLCAARDVLHPRDVPKFMSEFRWSSTSAMKLCKAPWSMPTAYEALQSNICGGIYYFKFQQGEDAMHPSYSVRRGRLTAQLPCRTRRPTPQLSTHIYLCSLFLMGTLRT